MKDCVMWHKILKKVNVLTIKLPSNSCCSELCLD